MNTPVPDQVPTSPFEILGLEEDAAVEERDILDAYAQRASRSRNEMELSATFQAAKSMALYLQQWRQEFSTDPDRPVTAHPDALSAEELTKHMQDGTTVDLERFRRTPIRTIRAAVKTFIWHRSAWNDLVRDQPTEVVATLLEVRAEELASVDDPDQLLYELQSEQVALVTKTSFLVQRAATSALAYLAWVLPEPAAQLAPSLVHGIADDETHENHFPNTVDIAESAFQLGGQLSNAGVLQTPAEHPFGPLLKDFVAFLHKAPVLSHQLSGPLLHQTAKQISEQPGLFFTLLFHRRPRPLPDIDRPDLDWRDFNPGANALLARYITLALNHLSLPILPAWLIENTDFGDLFHRTGESYRWLIHEAPSVKAGRFRLGLGLVWPSLLLGLGAAAGLIPLQWGLPGAAGLAGIAGASGLFQRAKSRHAAQIAVTSLTAMKSRIPIPLLAERAARGTDERNGSRAWLPPVPAPNDPIVLAMDAWDTLITLVARWARHDPTENHRNEQLRNQTDEPPAAQGDEPRHQG